MHFQGRLHNSKPHVHTVDHGLRCHVSVILKNRFVNDAARPHCSVSTVDLKMSVKYPSGCIIASPFTLHSLYAL